MIRSRVERGRMTRCLWWAEFEAAVWPVTVVVGDVGFQDGFEMAAPEDEDPVEAFASDGADPAFGVGVGLGCGRTHRHVSEWRCFSRPGMSRGRCTEQTQILCRVVEAGDPGHEVFRLWRGPRRRHHSRKCAHDRSGRGAKFWTKKGGGRWVQRLIR